MRRWVMSEAMHSADAELQMRCRILRNLVRGESPTVIAEFLGVSRSQVYRVAHRLLDDGAQGCAIAGRRTASSRSFHFLSGAGHYALLTCGLRPALGSHAPRSSFTRRDDSSVPVDSIVLCTSRCTLMIFTMAASVAPSASAWQ